MKSEKGPVRENPPGYEKLDARPVALLRFGAGLTILIVASLLVSHWLDEGLTPERETDNPYEPSPAPSRNGPGPSSRRIRTTRSTNIRRKRRAA